MTRDRAQELIQIMKLIIEKGSYYLPALGSQNEIKLRSASPQNDIFTVYINRSSKVNPNKFTLLLRYPEENLLRIDIAGPDHHNPDGEVIPCPHIHMRTKDTGRWDAYAYNLPSVFGDGLDQIELLRSFLLYCHVANITDITICEQREVGL